MKSESVTLKKIDVTEPDKYKVIFMNDNVTPIGFVIEILQKIFQYHTPTATELTMKIHNEGSAIVGVYDYSSAETRKELTDKFSKQYNYPLVVKIEKDK